MKYLTRKDQELHKSLKKGASIHGDITSFVASQWGIYIKQIANGQASKNGKPLPHPEAAGKKPLPVEDLSRLEQAGKEAKKQSEELQSL